MILAIWQQHEGQAPCSRRAGARAEQILRLALLAPDLIEAIVTGRAGRSLMLEKLERLLSPLHLRSPAS